MNTMNISVRDIQAGLHLFGSVSLNNTRPQDLECKVYEWGRARKRREIQNVNRVNSKHLAIPTNNAPFWAGFWAHCSALRYQEA